MKELRKFQSSTFDTIARRKLIEDQKPILELSGRIQELQNEVNCMNDSKDFQDAEWKLPRYQSTRVIPTSSDTRRIVETFFRIAEPQRRAAKHIWDTHGISGNVFADPHASSSAPYPQELNQWISSIEEPLHHPQLRKVKGQNKIKI